MESFESANYPTMSAHSFYCVVFFKLCPWSAQTILLMPWSYNLPSRLQDDNDNDRGCPRPRSAIVECVTCGGRRAHCFPAPSCHPHFHPWTPKPHCWRPNVATSYFHVLVNRISAFWSIVFPFLANALWASWLKSHGGSKSVVLWRARVSTTSFCRGSGSIALFMTSIVFAAAATWLIVISSPPL